MKKNTKAITIITTRETTEPMFCNYMPKYDIVTPSGYIVLDDLTRSEAIKCKRELIRMDKLDKTYVPHFYHIIEHPGITFEQAKAFYKDVLGSFGFDQESTTTHGIVYHEAIAERLSIPMCKAKPFINACYHYGITEKQGGGMVI